jgi:transcriptional regulator with GAF, ATPase, and Fis domain
MTTTVGMGRFVRVFGGTLAHPDARSSPFEIPTEPTVIGRDEGCGLRLDDPRVSSAHFEVTATPKGVRIRDLGSRNGTFVDDHECVEMHLLRAARIRCGETVLQFTPAEPVEVDAGPSEACGELVGTSAVMRGLFQRIRKVGATDLPVLITGETGTGKELVAHAIHAMSSRAHGPFVVQDCGAIPTELAESTLFGHERGAFTGAVDRLISPFVQADGGTIFLDEIGELPVGLQPKLLRAIQERAIKPVGSNAYRKVNVRIVAATRRDLGREINTGGFRSDLYFRLGVFRLEVPALRERLDDIPQLAESVAAKRGLGDAGRRLSAKSLERLGAHDWPGNVRELENVLSAAAALASPIGPIDVQGRLGDGARERSVAIHRSRIPFEMRASDQRVRSSWLPDAPRVRELSSSTVTWTRIPPITKSS